MERSELEALTKAQLVEKATELGLNVSGKTKAQIIDDLLSAESVEEATPEQVETPEEVVTTETPEPVHLNNAKLNRMKMEIAKRASRSKNGVASGRATTSTLQSELARRSTRFGKSPLVKDVSEALRQEIRNREIKVNS